MVRSRVSNKPLVSVIIPVYNTEKYLQECLDSLYAQTYDNIEILVTDDGSTDSSYEILKQNKKNHSKLKINTQSNHGQGYTRNRAMERARGEYIIFVDADDFIEPVTIEVAMDRILTDESDFVHYDWKLLTHNKNGEERLIYNNKELYFYKKILNNEECDELLESNNYFSVTNLFRKSFLLDNAIYFGENHIYEDFEFVVKIANMADKVSLIHSPLYTIRKNETSTVNSGHDTDKHYVGHISASVKSLKILNPRTEYSYYYLIKYLQKKFILYYERRTPRKYKKAFLKDFVDLISIYSDRVNIPERVFPDRIIRLCMKHGVYKDKRYRLFKLLISSKERILRPARKATRLAKRAVRKKATRVNTGVSVNYKTYLREPIIDEGILFLGFDYRYTGNSRYLFESMISDPRFKGYDIKYATSDTSVQDNFRIEPKSEKFFESLARYKYIIAESWTDRGFVKRDDTIWVQMWHGTPIKRLLFDSHEGVIMKRNDNNKILKYRDINKWNYMIADSEFAEDKFRSSLLIPKEKLLLSGYPRVKYLLDNRNNRKAITNIKKKIGIPIDKKVVFYAPTWRDYNLDKKDIHQDFNYVLDLQKLGEKLGDNYVVIYKDHDYLSKIPEESNKKIINVGSFETQDLLLVSDYVLSDYSSVIFDAIAINKQVRLFVNDLDKYETVRGVYGDIWNDLSPVIHGDIQNLVESIKTGKKVKIKNESKYIYTPEVDLMSVFLDKNTKR